jgi:Cu-processing system ATP-binding protein
VPAYDEDLYYAFGLHPIRGKLMRNLSGGTRQKVSACLAFLFSPGILILDEPTAGIDPLSREILKEKIILEKDRNRLILMTSHVLSDLEGLASHIVYLQEGKLLFYRPISELQVERGESNLNRLIAGIMKESTQNREAS